MVSLASTSRVMVFPVRVFTKICIVAFSGCADSETNCFMLTHSGMRDNDEAGLGGRNAQKLLVSFPDCTDMESSSA